MKKFSLLYVDDEESNVRIFKNTFRRDFNIYTATSAQDGIDILKQQKVDLILSDQRMPEMSGVEFLKYTLEKYPESNRILITGYADFNAIQDAVNQARIYQYVQKPWREDDLLSIIKKALRIYELELENQKHKRELEIALDQVKRSDSLKTAFLHNLSHEIRTPMNAIVGFSKFLINDSLSEEEHKNFAQLIVNSSDQLLHIVNQIMDISMIESGNVVKSESECNLNTFLSEISDQYKTKATEKNLDFSFKITVPQNKINFITDIQILKKIVGNIVENAIKYTSEGSIEIGVEEHNINNVRFYIKDTGIGISSENKDKIFIHFAHEDQYITTQYGGIGLGLSIAKGYTEFLGGDLYLESEKGKGSTFYIALPFYT